METVPATKTNQPPATGEPPATFANSTGPASKRRLKRAAQRKAAQSKPKQGPTAPATKAQSATTPPSSNTYYKQKRSAADHRHGTRATSRRQQASANSTQATANASNTTLPSSNKHSTATPSILTQEQLLITPNSANAQ
jgi:hypothetical protein